MHGLNKYNIHTKKYVSALLYNFAKRVVPSKTSVIKWEDSDKI
jgi:hypothetical protein